MEGTRLQLVSSFASTHAVVVSTLMELKPGKSSGQVSYLMAFVKDVRAKSIRNGRRDDLMNQIGFIRAAHSDKRNY